MAKQPSLSEIVQLRRAEEQMDSFFERELTPTCFKCGETLSEKNTSGACRKHWSQLPKKKAKAKGKK